MEPVTKMWNSTIDQLWDGDRYHQDIEQFTQYHLSIADAWRIIGTDRSEAMADLPTEVWECQPTYFSIALDTVIEECLDGFEGNGQPEARSIGEHESQTLYYDVEDDCHVPDLEGVEEFQKAIDRFCWWNFPIWSLFHYASWFNPERFSIGKYWLKKAIEGFDKANHDQWTYEYDPKLRVELTSEFWEEWDNGTK